MCCANFSHRLALRNAKAASSPSSSNCLSSPHNQIPSPGSHAPLCTLTSQSLDSISVNMALCNMQHTVNTFSMYFMSRKRIPWSRILHLFFMMPKTHSTSFLTLSILAEKKPFLQQHWLMFIRTD